jgi:hypothetical protein
MSWTLNRVARVIEEIFSQAMVHVEANINRLVSDASPDNQSRCWNSYLAQT